MASSEVAEHLRERVRGHPLRTARLHEVRRTSDFLNTTNVAADSYTRALGYFVVSDTAEAAVLHSRVGGGDCVLLEPRTERFDFQWNNCRVVGEVTDCSCDFYR